MAYDGHPNRWEPQPEGPSEPPFWLLRLYRALLWPRLILNEQVSRYGWHLLVLVGTEFFVHLIVSAFLFAFANPFLEGNTWWMYFLPFLALAYLVGIVVAFLSPPPKGREPAYV